MPEARLVSTKTKTKMMVRKTRMLPQQMTSVTRGGVHTVPSRQNLWRPPQNVSIVFQIPVALRHASPVQVCCTVSND